MTEQKIKTEIAEIELAIVQLKEQLFQKQIELLKHTFPKGVKVTFPYKGAVVIGIVESVGEFGNITLTSDNPKLAICVPHMAHNLIKKLPDGTGKQP